MTRRYRDRKPQRERPEAARAYEKYYALGPDRTLSLLAEQYWRESDQLDEHDRFVHNRKNQFGLWSTSFGWQQRVIKQDRKIFAADQRRHRAQIEKLNEDHLKWGQGMAALSMKQINDLIKAKTFGSHSAVLLFKYATDLQRLALGADAIAVHIEDENGDIDVSAPGGALPGKQAGSGNIMIFLPKKEALPDE